MKIEFIYSFYGAEQQRINLPFAMAILKNKTTLIDFAAAAITEDDKQDLVKISCCIELCNDQEKQQIVPEWYNKCKGKIWADTLELWRISRDIKSKVPNSFLDILKS